jgi:hypothetical protein
MSIAARTKLPPAASAPRLIESMDSWIKAGNIGTSASEQVRAGPAADIGASFGCSPLTTTLLGSGLRILQIVCCLWNIRGAEDIRFAKTCFAALEQSNEIK